MSSMLSWMWQDGELEYITASSLPLVLNYMGLLWNAHDNEGMENAKLIGMFLTIDCNEESTDIYHLNECAAMHDELMLTDYSEESVIEKCKTLIALDIIRRIKRE